MGYFTIDTKIIKNAITEMKNKEKYFLNKKDTFKASNYNSTGKITRNLAQVQQIYTSIASNINTLEKYIQEYVDDIESFENIMARHQGYVKAEGIYEEINKYKNLINNKYPYKNYLFDIKAMASTTTGLENQYKFGIHTQEEAKAIMDYFTDATAYYTMAGFTSEDINRLLKEEITPEELILEIQRDPDRTRMVKLTEATYLSNYTQGFKSMAELDEAIANLENQIKALNGSTKEEDIKNLEYFQEILDGCLEIKKLGVVGVTNLEDLDTKMGDYREQLSELLNNPAVFNYYECKNISSAVEGMMGSTSHSFSEFRTRYVAVKCIDKNGTEYYIYPDNVYEYQSTEDVTYEYVTFEEMYSGTELYEELMSVLSTQEDFNLAGDQKITTKVWKPTNKTADFYNKLTSMNTGYDKTYNDFISKNGVQIAQLQTNLDNYAFVKQSVLNDTKYYMNYIDVAAKNSDFEENSIFNEDCLNGLDSVFEKVASPFTNSPNVNDIARNSSNPSITYVKSKEQIVDIISCFINDKITIDTTGYVVYDNKYTRLDDKEELITHYAKWKEVLTDDEKKAFNYIVNKEGYEKAYEYLQSISTELDKRWYVTEAQKDTEWAQKSWGNSAAASVGSVLVTPIEGIDAFFESIDAKLRGNELYQSDVYSKGLTWRDAVASKINSSCGKYGETLAFLYSTGMSMADSGLLIAANTITGGSMSAVLSLALCGSRSYASSINDALARGVSTDKAILLAVSSTVVETAMENYSLGHLANLDAKLGNIASSLPSSLANALGNIPCADILTKATYLLGSAISQGICEGEEEFTTEIVNYLLDYFILKDDSKFITSLEQYGLEKTLQDLGQDAALAALGGFLSGNVFGGIHGITTVTKTSFAFANNMYGELNGDTRAEQFADALRINQEQEQLFQDAINKNKNNNNLTEEEINILQNGTINMQAGAQIKQNIISSFASKAQKLDDLFKEFIRDLFDEAVLKISPKTANYKYAALESESHINTDGFYASPNPLSSSSTAELVPLNKLLDILNNNDSYNNFLNMNSKDRNTYANAVYELLSTYQKGEISLTSEEVSIASNIVTNYSSLYSVTNTMKSNTYVNFIAQGKGSFSASAIFSDDFMQFYNLVKSGDIDSIINTPGNEVLLNFKNNVDKFIPRIADYVVNNNIELPYDCYNNFVNYLLNGRIDFNKANYLVTMDALGYTNYVTENSESITKIINSQKYFTTQMIPLFEKFFGNKVTNKQLHKKLDNTVVYLKDSIFKETNPSNWMGCNDGECSEIDIAYKDLNSIISHESIHQISSDVYIHNMSRKLKSFIENIPDLNIKASKVAFSGLEIGYYDSKGNDLGTSFKGFNEAVTEFFAKQISPTSQSGYDLAVNELDVLIKNGIFSMDLLQKSYLHNDILAVAKDFRNTLNLDNDSLFYELMDAFDKTALAENYADKQKALVQLQQLTTKINYIYANVLENNLEEIYGNEAISSKSDIFSEIETEQLIKVSSLINILTNPSAYNNFMNMDKSEKATYANAIRQLLNSSQANGYDLKLSDEALAIASNIISNYSIQDIAVIPDNDLSATADMIPISEILNILTDEESYQKFLQMDSNKQKLYIKAISQFLDASKDYEFGLSQENIELGRQIVQEYTQNADNNANINNDNNDINKDLIENRLISAIGKDEEYAKIIAEIKNCTDDNLPSGYSSVNEMKDSIVKKLKDSGVLTKMSNAYFYALIKDKYILKQFIGSDKLADLIVKNLVANPDTCAELFNGLSDIEINEIFDTSAIEKYFESMSDEEYLKVLKTFNKKEINALFSSKTFKNRFFNLDTNKLIDFFNKDFILFNLLSNSKNENGIDFLHSILDIFGNEEFLMAHPKLSDRLANIVPYCDEFAFYKKAINEINNKVIKTLKEKLSTNASIEIPLSGKLQDINGYYDLVYTLNGKKYTKSIQANFNSYDLLSAFTSEYYDDIMAGNIKIISLNPNDIKNVLYIKNIPEKGLYVITLEINGKVEKIVKDIKYYSIDLNYSYSNLNITSAKILSIESMPQSSYDITCDDVSSIYKMTYTASGIEKAIYLLPSQDGKLNINDYIVLKNLYNIKNINIQKIDINDDIRNKGNIFKYENGKDIFRTKYGGDQSDVRRIVISYLEGESLSQVDTAKSELLMELVKKYYPEATNTDIKNIVKAYEQCGCGYMAVANALATYIGSLKNGDKIFKDKIGFDLYFLDNDVKYYNLEAIALDIYLNSHKNVMNNFTIDALLKNSKGISGFAYSGYMTNYFESKGINVDTNVIHINGKNYNLDMIKSILNLDDKTFSIIASHQFDLEKLEADDIISNDGALVNSFKDNNLIKNVGDHAMIITGINEFNEFIVSSWSGKYKFIPTSKTGGMIFTLKFNMGG